MYDLYCKLCLVTDVKMSNMNTSILKAYSECIRLPLFNRENYVCYECAALLRKYQEFHSRCSHAHNILTAIITSHNSKITKESIQEINRKQCNLKSKLALSGTGVLYLGPLRGNVKEEENYFIDKIKPEIDHRQDNKEIDDVKIEISDWIVNKNVCIKSDTDSEFGEHIPDCNNTFIEVPVTNETVQNVNKGKKRKLTTRYTTSKIKKKKDKTTVTKNKRQKKSSSVLNDNQLKKVKVEVKKEEDILKSGSEIDVTAKKYVLRGIGPKFEESFFEGYAIVKLLTVEEAKNEVLLRKESSNYTCSAFKCDLCYKGCDSKKTFEIHQKKHSSEFGPFECEYCHLRFTTQNQLSYHLRRCHMRKFSCLFCSYVCFDTLQAKIHVSVHKEGSFECQDCNKYFKHYQSLQVHRRTKHAADCVCELCGGTFMTEQGLSLHKTKLHRQKLGKKTDLKGPKCEDCCVKFATETAWKRHLVLSPKHEVSNGCEVCGEVFLDKAALRAHTKGHVNYGSKKVPAACRICDKWLNNRREYKSHMTLQHPVSFAAKRVKDEKKSTKKYVCELCGESFKGKCFLQYHQWRHTGVSPYKCGICGEGFPDPGARFRHENRHGDGDQMFQCDVCRKTFNKKGNLTRHMEGHLGILPHKCPSCDHRFRYAGDIKRHIKYTHGKIPWPKGDGSRRKSKEINTGKFQITPS